MAQDLAQAYVQIIPTAKGISNNLASLFGSDAEQAGTSIGAQMVAGITKTVQASASKISSMLAQAVNVGMNFDAAMSQVAATMGVTVDEIGGLRDFAKEMGRTTAFTATQAAQALNYMALAGYDVQESMDMLPNVLNLAAAGSMDLALASDMVTDTQTAFGMSFDRTTEMVDEMAKAASTGNTSVKQLGEAFLVVGGLARELNSGMVTLEDGTQVQTDGIQELEIALTAMANAGVKGSEAGTHMRNMLLKLASPTSDGAVALEKLGVDVFDKVSGNMRSLGDIFGDLSTAMATLTQEEKLQTISDLFNTRDTAAAEALMNAMSEDWDKIGAAILNAQGAADKMAETQLDNLAGDMTLLNSATEGLQIEVFDQMSDPLRDAASMATDLVSTITQDLSESGTISDFIADLQEALPGVLDNVKSFAEAVGNFVSPVLELGGWLLKHPEVIEGLLIGIGSAIVTYNLATTLPSVVKGIGTLLTAMTGGTAGIILGVAAAVGVLFGALAGVMAKSARDRAAELAAHFGSIQLSLKELKVAADAIVDNGTLGTLDEALAGFTSSESAMSAMEKSVSELNKANWKISIGMELTEEDQAAYQSQIQSYVTACQKVVDENAYGVHLTLSLLNDAIETEGGAEDNLASSAVEKIESFYTGKQQELANLGKELNEYVTAAFNDGLLEIDEMEKIQELQQQMADIQAQMAGSTLGATLERIGMGFSGTDLTVESFKNLQAEVASAADDAAAAYGEAFEHAVAALNLTYNSGETDMTETEYQAELQALKEGYLNNLAEVQLQAQEFSLNTILEAYGDQIAEAAPEFIVSIQEALAEFATAQSYEGEYDYAYSNLYRALEDVDSGLSGKVESNIADLLEGMVSTEAMESIAAKAEELGVQVPEGVTKGLTDAAVLEAMTGDVDALFILVANELANSEDEDYVSMLNAAIDDGAEVPAAFSRTIKEHADDAKPAVDSVYKTTADYLTAVFANGFDVNAAIRVNATASTQVGSVPGHAAGAIITKPELALLAEAGYPESVIPWDGSKRAFDLWMQTGEGIGAFDAIRANLGVAEAAYAGGSYHASGQGGSDIMGAVNRILASVEALSRRQIVLDSGAVVGELADPLDTTIGQKVTYQSRRI